MKPFRYLPLLTAAFLFGQEPAPIKVNVGLVNVTFTVRNSSGSLARELKADDFEVLEDGVVQPVKFFGRSADLPLRLALIVDGSPSQNKFNRDHQHDVEVFLRGAITPKDRAMMIGFGNHLRIACDYTSDAGQLIKGLKQYDKGSSKLEELDPDDSRDGGTALFDAVYASATQKLAPFQRERKAIVLLSDGEDNASAHDVVEAIEAAQGADALIYTVRYTQAKKHGLSARNRYGITEMERMARETGGMAFDASKGHVSESLVQIGEELRSLYEIGYATTNPERDGLFRKILIRAKTPGLTVRAKSGYYSR